MPGYELIQVSSMGEVQTWETRNNRWSPPFQPRPGPQGYCYFVHQGKRHPVHQLVGLAFIGPPPSAGHTIDHIAKVPSDVIRERSDNRLTNLRYATRSEQIANRSALKTRCDARPVLLWKATDSASDAKRYESCGKAAVELGLDGGNLYRVASGKRPTISGYKAQFADTNEPAKVAEDEEFRFVRDAYKVSQYGRMIATRSGAFAYTPVAAKGAVYASVGTNVSFHHLVAEGWPEIVGVRPSSAHTLDHIDRDVANNRADNLRWATVSEQLHNQTRKPSVLIADVRKIAIDVLPPGGKWIRFDSIHNAARFMSNQLGCKIRDGTLSRGISAKPRGYTFKRQGANGWQIRRVASLQW